MSPEALTKTSKRPFVKICGLTRAADALLAAELGASALGFVFYPPSPRSIEAEVAKTIIAALESDASDKLWKSKQLWKVGVFVNSDYDSLMATAEIAGLTHLQLHGDESPELCLRLEAAGYQVIKALRLKRESDLERLAAYANLVLIDAAVPGVWGGSGQQADWELAAKAAANRQILLAGGLRPDSIYAALSAVRPWGLDLSSGVETAPGQKDPSLLKNLFSQACMKASETDANPDRS